VQDELTKIIYTMRNGLEQMLSELFIVDLRDKRVRIEKLDIYFIFQLARVSSKKNILGVIPV
jgi:hypothetical protein